MQAPGCTFSYIAKMCMSCLELLHLMIAVDVASRHCTIIVLTKGDDAHLCLPLCETGDDFESAAGRLKCSATWPARASRHHGQEARLLQPVCLEDDVQNRPQDKIRRLSRRSRIYRLIPEEPGVSELGSALEATGLGPVAHIYVTRKSRQVMD